MQYDATEFTTKIFVVRHMPIVIGQNHCAVHQKILAIR